LSGINASLEHSFILRHKIQKFNEKKYNCHPVSPSFLTRSIEMDMSFVLVGPPLISLLAGISILIWPRLLSYIVAFYLILFGLVGLLPLVL
jgi:hypothetical protein